MAKQPSKKKKKVASSSNIVFNIIIPLGIILVLILATLNLHFYLDRQEVLGTTTQAEEALSEIAFWENFLQNNERYLDGWLELARLNIENNNLQQAQDALNKADEINPNSKELLELKNLIY